MPMFYPYSKRSGFPERLIFSGRIITFFVYLIDMIFVKKPYLCEFPMDDR
jgi:hypothetical protein